VLILVAEEDDDDDLELDYEPETGEFSGNFLFIFCSF
jgi:hypothetical protein